MAHFIGTRGKNIMIFYFDIDEAHLSRYKYLDHFKAAKKGLINDYLHKVIYSISHLQDKSYEFIESNIHRKSSALSLPNVNSISDTSSINTSSSTSSENNKINHQNGSILLEIKFPGNNFF